MERVKCLKCGRIGYTACPDLTPCCHCGTIPKDMCLSYKVSIKAASMYTSNDGAFKLKINVSVMILVEDKAIFFVNNLTFCSLNEAESFNYIEFLRKKREDLFKYKSPVLTNEAAYLYIIDKRLHGGAS